ncbi:Cell division protein FtsI/penicillin-binding protein 2 [Bacillus sp. 491mf]|uniref:peptidoglycan D,D-transpeptidase FtsI family protein n=1 Tax=Bacillus sp. 491mf TaxID=1761755 RepID=UPI0008DF24D9|nr:penicillin-binding protein 2 [Bacillus sp. 491mf]SFC50973.1 Cell division protein FtsI/penicillin-binding protein 2 [Bacillus sp. 491mf]
MSKKKKKKKTHVPFRLNVLFFCVFLLFSSVIVKLGMIQIVHGEDYKNEVNRKENLTVSTPVPRGKIFDRYGRAVVDNTPLRTITFTRTKESKPDERLETAKQLAKLLDVPTDKLTERDKKDFWILLNEDRAKEKVTKKDDADFKAKKIDDKQLAQRQLNRITESEINELTPEDLKVLAIKSKMEGGYAMTPQIIKKDVTPEEYAIVSENLAKLPGVDTTVDWDRHYAYGDMFRTVLGGVTSSDEGLPRENLDYYLVRDYNRNDRVGKSYIEQQYEDVLHGMKAQVKNITDQKGNILETVYLSKGESGKNINLTIDMELQKKVEQIIEEEMKKAKASGTATYMDRAFVVMMNPKNGEILSMAGKQFGEENGQSVIKDYALGTMTSSYEMGSTVKGATLLTGYQEDAIKPGDVMVDEPIKFKSTEFKRSWQTMGPINDLTALQRSSNIYMFRTAMKIAGVDYVYNGTLSVKQKDFDTMRYYFSQFGLGAPTGIDLPNEMAGLKGNAPEPGKLLDLAIGQFDTYTPLQLAQYVSTIANGGYRMKPQVVKEIRKPTSKPEELGKVVDSVEPVVLNRVDMKDEYIHRVQEGFKMVMQTPEGTGYGTGYPNGFAGATYDPAGKTGTAQAAYAGPNAKEVRKQLGERNIYNLTMVGYAPASDPEVAFSVVVPWLTDDHNPVTKTISRRIMDAYFDLKKQEANGNAGKLEDTKKTNEEE